MNLFPLNKNSIALLFVAAVTIGFFIAGMLNILDYFIIKALLFFCFGGLITIAISYALKNETKKKRPEAKPQDDSH